MTYQPPFINGGRINASISGNTTGTAALLSTGTMYLAGGNNVTLSQNSNSITVSAGGGGAITDINVSAGTTSNNLSALTFSNSNGVSFGLNASTLTGSVAAQSSANVSLYALGNTTQNNSTVLNESNLSFNGLGNVTAGFSNGSIELSGQSNQQLSIYALSNTTQSTSMTANASNLSFAGYGNVSVGMSNSVVQLSAPTQTNQQITMYAAGNTTVSSTGTVNASSMNFYGAEGASIEVSANNVVVSAPTAPTLVTMSRSIYPNGMLTALSVFGNGSLSVRYMPIYGFVTGTRLDALVSWNAGSAPSNNTAAIAMTVFAGIYTLNASTVLSSLSTGSTKTTYTYASNSANWSSINGNMLPISAPVNVNMTPGEYYVGFGFSTNSSSVGTATTNLGQTVSMLGGGNLQSAPNYAEWMAGTQTSVNLYSGMGIFTNTTTAIPATIALNNISQTGNNLSIADIAIVIRNY